MVRPRRINAVRKQTWVGDTVNRRNGKRTSVPSPEARSTLVVAIHFLFFEGMQFLT